MKQIEKEGDMEALMMMMRMMANLLTIEQIGLDFTQKKEIYYKDILKKTKFILENVKIATHSELIISSLCLLSNLSFYEKNNQLLQMNNLELKKLKNDIIGCMLDFMVQADNSEVQIESLRILANFSRSKELVKCIEKQ